MDKSLIVISVAGTLYLQGAASRILYTKARIFGGFCAANKPLNCTVKKRPIDLEDFEPLMVSLKTAQWELMDAGYREIRARMALIDCKKKLSDMNSTEQLNNGLSFKR